MRRRIELLSGMVLGAGLMYLLDPDRGRRRRALLRDQAVHGARELRDARGDAISAARDLRNRARGAVAEARGRMRHEEVEDEILEARVRSAIGHVIGNAGALEVTAREGRVTLKGEVLGDDVQKLIARARAVRGVRSVETQLDVRPAPGDVPELQGARP